MNLLDIRISRGRRSISTKRLALSVSFCLFVGSSAEYVLEFSSRRNMSVCDNDIVRDVPGQHSAVLKAGQQYLVDIRNLTQKPLSEFKGVWQWELWRLLNDRDGTVPACKSLKVFGNEATNYDEAKRFCYFGDKLKKNQSCVVYSVGGNNQWDFEEYMHHGSNCDIETFDCTVKLFRLKSRIEQDSIKSVWEHRIV